MARRDRNFSFRARKHAGPATRNDDRAGRIGYRECRNRALRRKMGQRLSLEPLEQGAPHGPDSRRYIRVVQEPTDQGSETHRAAYTRGAPADRCRERGMGPGGEKPGCCVDQRQVVLEGSGRLRSRLNSTSSRSRSGEARMKSTKDCSLPLRRSNNSRDTTTATERPCRVMSCGPSRAESALSAGPDPDRSGRGASCRCSRTTGPCPAHRGSPCRS